MFGTKLRELRLEKGLTQKELANELGCNQSMIVRWEKNECEPTESNITKAAKFFERSSDYLLGLENEDGTKTY